MQSKNWNIKQILFVIVNSKENTSENVCFFLLLSKDWNIKDIICDLSFRGSIWKAGENISICSHFIKISSENVNIKET